MDKVRFPDVPTEKFRELENILSINVFDVEEILVG